ncbi:MAG: polyphosphate kinase 1 [Lentisphaeria bacterium]|nr:polyphosphate kinase 1 [Lentisphaeria bacterium]
MKLAKKHFINREISWLDFNQRVLAEAADAGKAPLERIKFLAITGSNLDEFFMVRVGGLISLRLANKRRACPAGYTPKMQLEAIEKKNRDMVEKQYTCFHELFDKTLPDAGITRLYPRTLTDEQEIRANELFDDDVFPLLTPMLLPDPDAATLAAPDLRNLRLYVAVRMREDSTREERLAVIPVQETVDSFFQLPAEKGKTGLLFCTDLIQAKIRRWFPREDILETTCFRITRNADFAIQEEEAPDLISGMEDVLAARTSGACIRMEINASASPAMETLLMSRLGNRHTQLFRIDGVIDLKTLMPLAFIDGFDHLKSAPWAPQPSPRVDPATPVFDQLREKDILLYHPYDAYTPVVRFVREAAVDPNVLAIKQVLYRTSADSSIVASLKEAAINGKSVTVLVELKARFDEARNISWAKELERMGVQVIYGVRKLKTHAKICLIIRREPRGIMRYMHFGTGNYNEATARLYGDISYMTCRRNLGNDASLFFNAICGYSQPVGMEKLLMAPFSLRDHLLTLIDGETQRASHGLKAAINAKMNALVDPILIAKLCEASCAGVKIDLNVRGICCLKPGVKKVSENIRVVSIVDRYLEHARIFHFYRDGDEQVFISSADWMPRNLDRRVELLIPVEDPAARQQLIDILNLHMKDTVKGWELTASGRYRPPTDSKQKKKRGSQEQLYLNAVKAVEDTAKRRPTALEPHRPV